MLNPLQFTDVFGRKHVEPSVTGLIQVQTTERPKGDLVNDLIILSPFRSGQPFHISSFDNPTALANFHDPDRTGDEGVALARIAGASFADDGMFGASNYLTVRVDRATPSTYTVHSGVTALITVTTADYGNHTRRSRCTIEAGTNVGKKVTLRDDSYRVFTGDNLGELLSIHYTGSGSACTLTIRRGGAVLAWNDQPADGDQFIVNGVTFEFDSDNNVSPGTIAVAIGVDAATTYGNAVPLVNANCPGVTATLDAAHTRITFDAPEEGIALTRPVGVTFTVAATGDPASLRTTITGAANGEPDLALPLAMPAFKSLAVLAAYISKQLGYSCRVSPYANKFLASAGLDVVAGVDIMSATYTATGYVVAIADFINNKTRQQYTAAILNSGVPDQEGPIYFTGGTTPPVTASDWEDALTLVGSEVELGGILLLDTDDPAVMKMTVDFIEEQRTVGKWFRAYFGAAPEQSAEELIALAGSLDSSRSHLFCQRMGVFADDGSVTYLHPLFLAAAVAGGASGNKPWVNPLTNKRLRFAALHDDDSFDLDTRESLLGGGVTVVKREQGTIRVALHVTTSQDPDRRMPRIASEMATVDNIDSDVRFSFLQFRGKWANSNITARVLGVLGGVLNRYKNDEGALVDGVDDFNVARRAWNFGNPPSVIEAGVLRLNYSVFIGGELNHVSEIGLADYQRLVGSLPSSSGAQDYSTAIPVR